MNASTRFRCVVVGTESLLIHCASILQQHGHEVAAVVSSDAAIARWAEEHGAALVAFDKALDASLAAIGPFDYLFSIANLRVLPDDVVKLAARGAINFHDGPLPRYAGLYATTWALMHRELRHGVAWHFIADGIDTGDILARDDFDLDEGETALTLNAKCYEAGIRTFVTLADDLTNGTLRREPQDMRERTYFGAFKRPEAVCAINWDRPADDIAAFVRALDFGAYTNPLGLPHAMIDGHLFGVTAVDVLGDRAGAGTGAGDASTMAPRTAPGTVIAIEEQGWRVATATTDVRITRVTTGEGARIGLDELASRLGVRAGSRLGTLVPEQAARLTALHERISRHESFWRTRLETRAPIDLAYVSLEALARPSAARERLETRLPEAFVTAFAGRVSGEDAVGVSGVAGSGVAGLTAAETGVAAMAAWLARLTDAASFDLAFSDDALRTAVGDAGAWFADVVPMRVRLAPEQTLAQQIEAVGRELAELRKRVTFTRDLYARHPSLRGAASSSTVRWPVRLELDGAGGSASSASSGSSDHRDRDDNAALTIRVAADGSCAWEFDRAAIAADDVRRLQRQLEAFLGDAAAHPDRAARELSLLPADERQRVLVDWNQTALPYPADRCVHELIEAQAARTPDREAIAHRAESITYRALDDRANRLARHLTSLGVGPDIIVGLAAERSIDMMVGLLGILKAGGAYLPLDPDYPADRLQFMVEDSQAPIVVTQRTLGATVPPRVKTVFVDDPALLEHGGDSATAASGTAARSSNLAYVIYTSGSTGKPKGVMITHRNVGNFFAAMDQRLDDDRDGVWLAVTSLSFDISVLELLWTLARGFKVVLHGGQSARAASTPATAAGHLPRFAAPPDGSARITPRDGLDFSLFYFASDEGQDPAERYRVLLEGAKFADREGFAAVWTPERHFHAFGGLYPNPSVVSGAIAAITSRVHIRAGSVVLPLHHPARVAEEWSVVDNLSGGRVGISFASGWQPNDFLLQPANFRDAKGIMMRNIDVVRRLWRGEQVEFPGPNDKPVTIGTLPRPIQRELPTWITSAGNPETFRMAGEAGAFVLTHLLGQSVGDLKDKLQAYRDAWKAAGHPGDGHVTLMLHTYVGDNDDEVREIVRGPMKKYLASSVSLIKGYASTFPAFKKMGPGAADVDTLFAALGPDDLDALLDHSFARYYETGGLFGTPDSCMAMIADIQAIGVDEVACLIDFGVPTETVLRGLDQLNVLRQRYTGSDVDADADTHAAEIARHAVTHLQCTPSLASMLAADVDSRRALGQLRRLLVGGEALSADLANDLRRATTGSLINMYGPTETTVWSSTQVVDDSGRAVATAAVPIGRPIANTQLYILDRHRQPVPVGLAGELYIGGDGVTRGYLHRPELTAERFVHDPFTSNGQRESSAGDGARLYRTGDLVRYRDDGVIEFLGRIDHQVKIRGHRIELGEIESALRADPSVREAVVVVREDTPGDARLVGYLVAQTGAARSLDADALKTRLKASLPDIMIPSAFVVLDALPLTPNGKIDRRSLPSPASAAAKAAGGGAAGTTVSRGGAGVTSTESGTAAPAGSLTPTMPQTEAEATIAAIWQEVLHLPSVGLDDNFFDLGGHSLLTVQVLAKMREQSGQNIPITDMFRFPTVRLLAQHLSGRSTGSAALERGQARADARRNALRRRVEPRR